MVVALDQAGLHGQGQLLPAIRWASPRSSTCWIRSLRRPVQQHHLPSAVLGCGTTVPLTDTSNLRQPTGADQLCTEFLQQPGLRAAAGNPGRTTAPDFNPDHVLLVALRRQPTTCSGDQSSTGIRSLSLAQLPIEESLGLASRAQPILSTSHHWQRFRTRSSQELMG